MENNKIIMLLTGPVINYRLDLFEYCCPLILKDKIIFFTDRFTYDSLGERRNKYQFVLIDDYRKDDAISLEYEKLINIWDEAEYYDEIRNFYSYEKGRLYPYDIVRFVFKYLAENNITNFILMDSDNLIRNSPEKIDEVFDRTKVGTFYMPHFSLDPRLPHYNKLFSENFGQKYPQISFDLDEMITADGYVKGFHFKNNEDTLLFFNLWNDSVNYLVSNFFKTELVSHNVNIFCDTFWILPYLMQLFQKNLSGYTYGHSHSYMWDAFLHMTRAEEKLYYGGEIWYYKHYNFNYDNVRTVADFVKNNKEQLIKYYGERTNHEFQYEVTDTHVLIKYL